MSNMYTTSKRGDIYLVKLNNNEEKSSIPKGEMPCIIIQNDIGNRFSPVSICIPIFQSKQDANHIPIYVKIENEDIEFLEGEIPQNLIARCDLITTIDKKMMIKQIGKLKQEILNTKIKNALLINLGFQSPIKQ